MKEDPVTRLWDQHREMEMEPDNEPSEPAMMRWTMGDGMLANMEKEDANTDR